MPSQSPPPRIGSYLIGGLEGSVLVVGAGKTLDQTTSLPQSSILGLTDSLASKANASHSHMIEEVVDLQTALNSKANASTLNSHVQAENPHSISAEVIGVYTTSQVDDALAGKSDTGHSHSANDIISGTLSTNRLPITPVSPGSYSSANITVDEFGRITAASSGGGGGAVDSVDGRTGIVTLTDLYSSINHTHDDRYYTESETNTLLAAKSDTGHTHAIADVTNLQSTLDSKAGATTVNTHIANTANPHEVTAAQVGAYTTTEVDTALAGKSDSGHTHPAAGSNTQIIFNSGGVPAGDESLTFDSSKDHLNVGVRPGRLTAGLFDNAGVYVTGSSNTGICFVGVASQPGIVTYKDTSPVAGERIGFSLYGAFVGTTYGHGCGINAYAESTWTGSSFPCYFEFQSAYNSTNRATRMSVGKADVGATIQGRAGSSANLLECQNSGGGIKFAVGPDGELRTNQSAAATTPGTITGKMPIYSATGTLLGYIPIYDNIT